MGHVKARLALCAGLASGASSAIAQDAVVGGHFNSGVGPWAPTPFAALAWDPLDWEASPPSGSARVTNASPVALEERGAGQCVPIATAGSHEIAAYIRFPSGQGAAAGEAFVAVTWFLNPTCAVPSSGTATTAGLLSTSQDAWVQKSTSLKVPIPPGAQSVRVQLTVVGNGSALTALFDRVRFGPIGSTPVELQGFGVE